MNVRSRLLALGCIALLAATAAAQDRDQRKASVGMRAFVEQLVLPGSELVAAPTTVDSDLVVRVLKVWPHGDHFRYDLEWSGMVPGSYDLRAGLVRKDGSSTDDLPAIAVEVESRLDPDVNEPVEPAPKELPRLDGYSRWQVAFWIAWGVGLLALLFVGQKRRPRAAPPAPVPTLADRLRPLVEEVASGRADEARKAELERLLVAFWRARLDLGAQKAGDAIVAIRRHAEAGALLRQVEAWLHMPNPPAKVDVAALLQPYRSVTADSFAPLPAAARSPAAAQRPAEVR